MRLRLKPCTVSEVDTLADISRKTFVTSFESQNNPDDFKVYVDAAFDRNKLLQEIANPHTFFHFVYQDAELVGYFKVNVEDAQTDIKTSDCVELERIYISEEYQGMGIGKWVLQEVKALAKKMRKEFLWLGVWEDNPKAIEFYERHGFSKFGTHPYFIGSDEQTDWLMRYDLRNFDGL